MQGYHDLTVCTSERSVGPLSDFFEDLILHDCYREGYAGDVLQSNYLERKIQLSTVLDRFAEEGYRELEQGNTLNWQESLLSIGGKKGSHHSEWEVVLTGKVQGMMRNLPHRVLCSVPHILSQLEDDPLGFKRLRGPYSPIYRVSFSGEQIKHYRVIYTLDVDKEVVIILLIGERKRIYQELKEMNVL